jgi:hypothetical protein
MPIPLHDGFTRVLPKKRISEVPTSKPLVEFETARAELRHVHEAIGRINGAAFSFAPSVGHRRGAAGAISTGNVDPAACAWLVGGRGTPRSR